MADLMAAVDSDANWGDDAVEEPIDLPLPPLTPTTEDHDGGLDSPAAATDELPTRPPFKMFVANLPYDVTAETLKEILSERIKVVDVQMFRKGQCVVEFPSREDLQQGLTFGGSEVYGRVVHVKVDRNAGKPRRKKMDKVPSFERKPRASPTSPGAGPAAPFDKPFPRAKPAKPETAPIPTEEEIKSRPFKLNLKPRTVDAPVGGRAAAAPPSIFGKGNPKPVLEDDEEASKEGEHTNEAKEATEAGVSTKPAGRPVKILSRQPPSGEKREARSPREPRSRADNKTERFSRKEGERSDRAERGDRPERVEKAERGERPERGERSERPRRFVRSDGKTSGGPASNAAPSADSSRDDGVNLKRGVNLKATNPWRTGAASSESQQQPTAAAPAARSGGSNRSSRPSGDSKAAPSTEKAQSKPEKVGAWGQRPPAGALGRAMKEETAGEEATGSADIVEVTEKKEEVKPAATDSTSEEAPAAQSGPRGRGRGRTHSFDRQGEGRERGERGERGGRGRGRGGRGRGRGGRDIGDRQPRRGQNGEEGTPSRGGRGRGRGGSRGGRGGWGGNSNKREHTSSDGWERGKIVAPRAAAEPSAPAPAAEDAKNTRSNKFEALSDMDL